jgi:hypothetical protein
MNTLKALLCALAAGALLAGCAGHHPMSGDADGGGGGRIIAPALVCPPQACDAYVKVWTDPGGTCRLQVSDETITVPRTKSPVLTWQLRPQNTADGFDYQFDPATGIAFKTTSPITPDDFGGNQVLGPDNSKYKWKAVNKRARAFFYNVNVQRRVPGGAWANCPVLDPRIVNDGS